MKAMNRVGLIMMFLLEEIPLTNILVPILMKTDSFKEKMNKEENMEKEEVLGIRRSQKVILEDSEIIIRTLISEGILSANLKENFHHFKVIIRIQEPLIKTRVMVIDLMEAEINF